MSEEKIIAIEERKGPLRLLLRRIMRMVPDRDRQDTNLQQSSYDLPHHQEQHHRQQDMTCFHGASLCRSSLH